MADVSANAGVARNVAAENTGTALSAVRNGSVPIIFPRLKFLYSMSRFHVADTPHVRHAASAEPAVAKLPIRQDPGSAAHRALNNRALHWVEGPDQSASLSVSPV